MLGGTFSKELKDSVGSKVSLPTCLADAAKMVQRSSMVLPAPYAYIKKVKCKVLPTPRVPIGQC